MPGNGSDDTEERTTPVSDALVPAGCSRVVWGERARATRQPRPITDIAPAVIA
jgi:hypothetical protein